MSGSLLALALLLQLVGLLAGIAAIRSRGLGPFSSESGTVRAAAAFVAAAAMAAFVFAISEPGLLFSDFRKALLFAANGPLVYSLKEGNTSHMVLLGLVAALIFLRRRRDLAAGIVLGVCALIKLPLLILGAYFVLRRNWAAVAGFSGVLAVSGLLSILVFGWALNQRWFELCVLQFGSNPIGAFNVQSIPSFLVRLGGDASVLRDWSAVGIAPLQRFIGTGLVLLMALVAIVVCARRPETANERERSDLFAHEYALVVALSVISSPMSWTHYYCWLLIPVALFLKPGGAVASSPAARRAAWLGILLISPAVVLLSFDAPLLEFLYVKVLLSHVLAGGLIVYGLLIWALARAEPRYVGSAGAPALSLES